MALTDSERKLLDAIVASSDDEGVLGLLCAQPAVARGLARPGASRRDGVSALAHAFSARLEKTSKHLMALGASPWWSAQGASSARSDGPNALAALPSSNPRQRAELAQALMWISDAGRAPALNAECLAFSERALDSQESRFYPAVLAIHRHAKAMLSEQAHAQHSSLASLGGPRNALAQKASRVAQAFDNAQAARLALDLGWDPSADCGADLAESGSQLKLMLPESARCSGAALAALRGNVNVLRCLDERGFDLSMPENLPEGPFFQIHRHSSRSRATSGSATQILSPLAAALATPFSGASPFDETHARRASAAEFLVEWHERQGRALSSESHALGQLPIGPRLFVAGGQALFAKGAALRAPFSAGKEWPIHRSFLFFVSRDDEMALHVCAEKIAVEGGPAQLARAFCDIARVVSRSASPETTQGLRWDMARIALSQFDLGAQALCAAGLDLNHPLALVSAFEATDQSGAISEAWDIARAHGQRMENLPAAILACQNDASLAAESPLRASRIRVFSTGLHASVVLRTLETPDAWALRSLPEPRETGQTFSRAVAALERLSEWGLAPDAPSEARALAQAVCQRPGPQGELFDWGFGRLPLIAWKSANEKTGAADTPLGAWLTRFSELGATHERRILKTLLKHADPLFGAPGSDCDSVFALACAHAPLARFDLLARLAERAFLAQSAESKSNPFDLAFSALAQADGRSSRSEEQAREKAAKMARSLLKAGLCVDALASDGSCPLSRMAGKIIEDKRLDSRNGRQMALYFFHELARSASNAEWSRRPLSACGQPAAVAAAKSGRLNALRVLLNAGACADTTNSQHKNALHYVAGSLARHWEWTFSRDSSVTLSRLIIQLIAAGVDPSAQDKSGKSADEYFQEQARARKIALPSELLAAIEQASLRRVAQSALSGAASATAIAPATRTRRL